MTSLPDPSLGDTRESLLEAALFCFAKYGYEAASIRLVAAMAGKNSSLIAYHFGHKEGLYREVIHYLLSHFSGPFPEASGATARQRLHAFIHWLLSDLSDLADARLSQDPKWIAARRLWLSELHFPRPEARDLLQAYLAKPTQELHGIIRAIRPDLDDGDVAFWGLAVKGCCLAPLFVGLNGLVWPEAEPTLDREALAGRFTELIHTGLTCR